MIRSKLRKALKDLPFKEHLKDFGGRNLPYKLIAFDMDGTLLEGKSSWGLINLHFGTLEMAFRYLSDYEKGMITYREFMQKVISSWKPGVHISEIERVLGKIRFKSNVPSTMKKIKERGYQTAIVSGGLETRAERAAKELRIDHVLANGIEVDERGYLTGKGIVRVELLSKHLALERLAGELNVGLSECVAVGDSRYDINFLKRAGLGIAIGEDPELTKVANLTIDRFEELLNYL